MSGRSIPAEHAHALARWATVIEAGGVFFILRDHDPHAPIDESLAAAAAPEE